MSEGFDILWRRLYVSGGIRVDQPFWTCHTEPRPLGGLLVSPVNSMSAVGEWEVFFHANLANGLHGILPELHPHLSNDWLCNMVLDRCQLNLQS